MIIIIIIVIVIRWVVVDLMTGSVNHPEEIESRCSKPVTYCLAVNHGKVKDVTAR